jgi:hypothetical protein
MLLGWEFHVARVGVPFGIICDEGVGVTRVEGAAHALSCSSQRFLPIRKMNSGVRVIHEGRLKNGHSDVHLYSDDDEKGGGGML